MFRLKNRKEVEEMYPVIGRCPVCSDELTVVKLHCPTCATDIEGSFSLGRLQRLEQAQLQFVEAFVRCRGSMKDVGAELNMSYPTVNNRLNEILMAMGYGDRVKAQEDGTPSNGLTQEPTPERKREILTRLREGKISAGDAERLLKGKAER
jgi:hypothetical protein